MNGELLETTLFDATRFLADQSIPHALIGGLAASLRGQPRVTADVDIVIATDVDGTLSLLHKLDKSPFAPLFHGVEEVVTQAFILPVRHNVTGIKVDLSIGLSGFEKQTIARAEILSLGNRNVAVATAEDLIILKTIAGRPRDEQDIRGIVIAQQDRLDWVYCLRVAEELQEAIGLDLVERIRSLRSVIKTRFHDS